MSMCSLPWSWGKSARQRLAEWLDAWDQLGRTARENLSAVPGVPDTPTAVPPREPAAREAAASREGAALPRTGKGALPSRLPSWAPPLPRQEEVSGPHGWLRRGMPYSFTTPQPHLLSYKSRKQTSRCACPVHVLGPAPDLPPREPAASMPGQRVQKRQLRARSHRPIPLTNSLAVETRGPAR